MEKKVKWIVFFTLAIVFFTTLLLANDEAAQSSEEKIDSIYVWQKEMYRTHKDEPLIGKRYGVELNFIRFLLFGSDTDGINHTLSGGVSLFYHEKNVELSFPFLYSDPDYGEESHRRKFTLDFQYRKYLGNTLNKFYLAGVLRYAYSKHFGYDYVEGTENALGLGFGMGYRIYSYKGLYWGTNILVGRYFVGKMNSWIGSKSDLLLSVSLFKFGYAF